MQTRDSLDPLSARAAVGAEAKAAETPAGAPVPAATHPAMRAIDAIAEALVVVALLGELILVLANVVARVYFHTSFIWSDEIARLSLSILAFIGGAVAYRRGDHAFVRILLNLTPEPVEHCCLALSDIIVLFVVGLTGVASAQFIASSWGERTPILQVPAALIAMPLPIGMALFMFYALDNLYRNDSWKACGVGIGFIAALAIAALTREFWLPLLGGDAAIITALILFFVAAGRRQGLEAAHAAGTANPGLDGGGMHWPHTRCSADGRSRTR
jgi:TRAP-type C4-dicarboxylate transport system permease small subunit